MKTLLPMSRRFAMLLATLWVFAALNQVKADTVVPKVYASNLNYVWPDSTVGDIHDLFPGGTPYGADTARFVTGAGSDFQLSSLTFEIFGGAPQAQGGYLNIQLFQQSGNVLLGNLGNPTVNSRQTQWRGTTTFVDFSPLARIVLNPVTEYSVLLSVPATAGPVSLMFTAPGGSDTTLTTDWSLRTTLSGNPSAPEETLIMAVTATPVPEPSSVALLTIVVIAGGLYLVHRRVRKDRDPIMAANGAA